MGGLGRLSGTLALVALATACSTTPSTKSAWPAVPKAERHRSRNTVKSLQDSKTPAHEMKPSASIDYDRQRFPAVRARRPTVLEFGWPIPARGVTSLYGMRPDPLGAGARFHRGLDLEADYGAGVRAAEAGQVVSAGWNGGYGRQIIIEHRGGFQTIYAHLSRIDVVRGQRVRDGAPIGLVGTSGRSTGPHLHFELTRWGKHVDPLEFFGSPIAVEQ